MKPSKLSLFTLSLTLLAQAPLALAIDAPDELPLVGLERGSNIEATQVVTIPPAAALTGISYQGGQFKQYYPVGQLDQPKVVNGGLNDTQPICVIYVKKNRKSFGFILKEEKIEITRVRPSHVELYTAAHPFIEKISCHNPDFRNGDEITVPQLEAALGRKINVLIPPYETKK
jgi:hypothetical protein